jgi:hypothetical protein
MAKRAGTPTTALAEAAAAAVAAAAVFAAAAAVVAAAAADVAAAAAADARRSTPEFCQVLFEVLFHTKHRGRGSVTGGGRQCHGLWPVEVSRSILEEMVCKQVSTGHA